MTTTSTGSPAEHAGFESTTPDPETRARAKRLTDEQALADKLREHAEDPGRSDRERQAWRRLLDELNRQLRTEGKPLLGDLNGAIEADADQASRQHQMAAHWYGPQALRAMPPQRFLIDGWFPLNAVGAIVAPPGKGKTFYALALTLELARGGTYAGQPLGEPLEVLYVAAERFGITRDRFVAWEQYHHPAPDTFRIYPPDVFSLNDQADLDTLCECVKANQVRVVVFDTFAQVTLGLEENSSREMGPVMAALRRVLTATDGGLVLVLHHTGKDTSRGPRGSSAFEAAADFVITLDGDPQALRASVTKINKGAEPLPEWFRIASVGIDDGQQEGVLISALPQDVGSKYDDAVFEYLSEVAPDGDSLRGILEGLELDDSKRKTIQRRLNQLEKLGQLTKLGKGPRGLTWRLGPAHPLYMPAID